MAKKAAKKVEEVVEEMKEEGIEVEVVEDSAEYEVRTLDNGSVVHIYPDGSMVKP
jgi:predicted HAD superfamily phosphohydrolase YqeG